jgi:2-polyprenyl-3-methyl-5-hydroxy-6-metoxy-1,4-benzoquinol methylase
MPDLSTRTNIPELMDTAPESAAAMSGALRFLELSNRWFGGSRLVLSHLATWAARWPGAVHPITVLDVGTGTADIPMALVRWARARGLRLAVTGLDMVKSIAELAQARVRSFPEISIVRGDLFALATAGVRYDYVTASLFLHHIEPARTPEALGILSGLARRGLIVSELQRTRASYLAITAAGYALGNRIVRHDAPASVRRAFLRNELDGLARQAGLDYLAARTEPFFRLSLAGEKPDAW